MLRREFLAAIASFTAAGAAAKAALAATTPQEKAGQWIRDFACRRPASDAGACLVPQEFSDALSKALDERSQFERVLVECLRDGSMTLLGVTTHAGSDYRAVYRPAVPADRQSPEIRRHEALLAMYDRGLIVMDRVNVYAGYSAVEVIFAICTKGDY